jgi:hypothetical protein
MSASIAARGRLDIFPLLRRSGPMLLLIAATYGLGIAGQSLARPLFILGCVAVSWDLIRFGASAHFAGCLTLFCLAPFLRRVVDVYAGYEPSGLMISGPYLAIAIVAPRLLSSLASGRPLDPALRPFLLFFGCVLYGSLLTLINGGISVAATNGLKWFAPLIYAIWIFGEASREKDILAAPTLVAMVLMPLLGLYGLLQYVNPPIWDQFWMNNTTIASIGLPEPYMVRVFSTMNAPAGYATFTAAALLLFGFRKARVSLLLAAGPATLGLMLTMYRTAWIGLAVGVVLGLFNRRTRGRAAVLLLAVPILGALAMFFTPAGEALQDRLLSLGSVASDASGQERLGEYAALLNADDGTLVGHGFGANDVLQAGIMAVDGQIIECWYSMGLVLGMICLLAVVWAGVQAVRVSWPSDSLSGLAVAGIMTALLAQLPLASIASSETGFLFWSIAAIGAATRPKIAR